MTLSRRVKKIEGLQRSLIHVVPTVIRLIYEPSKTGPKEVGVIACKTHSNNGPQKRLRIAVVAE